MATLGQFETRITKMAQDIENRANRSIKDVALGISREVINDSPVDTTRFASNWRIGIGQPASRYILPHFPGRHGVTAIQSKLQALQIASERIADSAPGTAIWISNITPYGVMLNQGSSGQAAAGWVERGVRRGVRNAIRQFRGPLVTRF